ncbi:MFS transporter [Brucella intermedia]|uniref:MFS transporter n=1 Tax=Brucella intermedia TaxID=94625 RepID=UPI0020003DEF|nr:MFS transporter [Brucella intermedia]
MTSTSTPRQSTERLPVGALLALAMAGVITLMTEVMPAGLLQQISPSLGITDSLAGQMISVYAAGSFLTAIPLITFTQKLRRRPLLLMAIVGFAVVNAVTALSNSFALMLIARFCAGISAGLVWALLVGYAARLAPSHLAGRAIAIVGISAPLAFSFGVPAGTFIGALAGWRLAFGLMSLLALALAIVIHFIVPDLPGQKQEQRFSVPDTLRIPGVLKILGMTLAFVIAHNILYTYVSPFLSLSGLSARADMVLFIFGIAGIAGLWVVGTFIDRKLWPMMQGSIIVVAVCALAFGVWNTSPLIVLATAGLWGLIFGGVPTLLQTALAKAAGSAADVAQAMLVTFWNLAIAAGGLIGGLVLGGLGAGYLPWAMVAFLAVTWLISLQSHAVELSAETQP